MILYEGKSEIEKDKDIVVIATGIKGKSKNPKTGDMVQTWVLLKDERPNDAVKSGADSAICGDCKHRPFNGGKCYVNTWQAPLSVWKAYQKGKYSKPSDKEISEAVANRKVKDRALKNKLQEFSDGYEKFNDEEYLAELVGFLGDNYDSLGPKGKNIIKRWLEKIGEILGREPEINVDADVLELLNTIGKSVKRGEELRS